MVYKFGDEWLHHANKQKKVLGSVCNCDYAQRFFLFFGVLLTLMTIGWWMGFLKILMPVNVMLYKLILTFSSFFVFLFKPIGWVRCEKCNSRFTDTLHHDVEFETIYGGPSKLVTHCRICGHNKIEPSYYVRMPIS